MRSKIGVCGGQEPLWDDDAAEGTATEESSLPAKRRARRPRARGTLREPAAPLFDPSGVYRLEGDDFARTGWPAGTLMHLTPAGRASRGDLVVVREAGRTRVGWFGADRGRPALLTDAGATWLSERARVVALVTAVEATLCR